MHHRIRDVMTTEPVTLSANDSAEDAARAMRDRNIGDVIVLDEGKVCGIVTDRDIVVRTLAARRDPRTTKLSEIASRELTTLSPDDSVEHAVELMRQKAVRRLPVVEGDRPVGILSIGDLAVDRDRRSALADISTAPPNR